MPRTIDGGIGRRARIREIFVEHGVPTDEIVGDAAAEEFVVMLSGEPEAFLERVLPRIKEASDAGKISSNSYVYLHAEAHRRQIREKWGSPPQDRTLEEEIERLTKADQAVRPSGKPLDLKKMAATDRADGIEVRAILAKHGLPTFALVGPQAAQDFDIVIQHQPLDLQKQVLPQMKAAVEAGQVDSQNYAMLLDRVESNSDRPQTYGENFVCTPDGSLEPAPIADPAGVDRRRAELGLMPLALYRKILAKGMGPFCAQIAAAFTLRTPSASGRLNQARVWRLMADCIDRLSGAKFHRQMQTTAIVHPLARPVRPASLPTSRFFPSDRAR